MTLPTSTPYPWPYDGSVAPARTALVIAGNDPRSCSLARLDPVAMTNLAALRAALGSLGVLVVLVHHELLAQQRPLTAHDEVPVPLEALPGEVVVHCGGHDGFYGGPLEIVLMRRHRTHLVLAGFGFETAVHSTLRSANDRGFECLTVSDAVCCVDPSIHSRAVSTIEMSGGIFGAVATTSDLLHYFSNESDR